MMHRVVVIGKGGTRLHLLRIAGELVAFGAAIGILSTVASMLRLMKQLEIAQSDPSFSLLVLHLPSTALNGETILGFFMEPLAWLLLWFALLCIGVMVYRSEKLVFPIEE